jgi:hypothetical protein
MTDQDAQLLAAEWIAFWKSPEGSNQRELLSWTTDKEWELVRESPQDGWRLILAILQLDNSSEIQEVLSAGPLEDLLSYHGEAMIDAVEREARRNPRFAMLLGGVWKNSMSEAVWSRVQAVWNRKGWDGEA